MSEKPILFSTPMVKAILEGRKTQTRRIVKPQPEETFGGIHEDDMPKAHWQPGDRLWVRETFWWDWADYPERTKKWFVYKATDPDWIMASGCRWSPSIHMPKAAARIWLEVVEVRVERLQDISEEDAIAEGIEFQEWEWGTIAFPTLNYPDDEDVTIDRSMVGVKTKAFKDYMVKEHWHLGGAVKSYSTLWQSINGPESWEQNPFVWVVKFKRIV